MTYITIDEAREWIRLSDRVTDGDPKLAACIEAACADIDRWCGRTFSPVAEEPSPRIYAALTSRCYTDDFGSLDDLIVETSSDRSTWNELAASLWFPGPEGRETFGEPWTFIELSSTSTTWVRVTARWGWPDTPAAVKTAAKLVTHWLYKRSASPFGIEALDVMPTRVGGSGDPDARRLLAPLRRMDRVMGLA